jgi:hypothetical protein
MFLLGREALVSVASGKAENHFNKATEIVKEIGAKDFLS